MGWIEQNGGVKEMGFMRQAEARGFPGASKADEGVVGLIRWEPSALSFEQTTLAMGKKTNLAREGKENGPR